VYHGHVTTRASDVRTSGVLGHWLRVRLSEDGSWRVAVDGEESLVRCGTAYSAWAIGAAESYRLGRAARLAPSNS
jgi:hypothetical protein